MTAFNDDDLKRLKDRLNAAMRSVDPYCPSLTLDDLPPLLARLEAAELVCRTLSPERPRNVLWAALQRRAEAWRKAAGK